MQTINFPPITFKVNGLEETKIPKMVKVKQIYDASKIEDLKAHVEAEFENNLVNKEKFAGKRIAVTVGSRGIPNIDLITKTLVDKLKQYGANPFIVPAMGSHGGATAEGQLEILESYNITEETMGCPIRSSMEVVQIGTLEDGTPVYCDKYAFESDGIVVANKVKPHTHFRGPHESGIAKMMAIGLAKHKGAAMFHQQGFKTFAKRIPEVCNVFLEKAPIAFGLGLVQNAYDEISDLRVMEKEDILKVDAELQVIAKDKLAKFLFNRIDVLIVDEIGKNISGYGADPNVTGRSSKPGFEDVIDIERVIYRGTTEETHHNATGLGAADIVTRRFLNTVDFESTWLNLATATEIVGGRIPMYFENDKLAIKAAIVTCNGINYDNAKVVRIKDTLTMEHIEVSEAYIDELKDDPRFEIIGEPYEINFGEDGYIVD